MKPTVLIVFLSLFGSSLVQAQLHASVRAIGEGGSSTGGADTGHATVDTAWYLGQDQARTICIAGRETGYPVFEARARESITQAYDIWRRYVTAKVLPIYGLALTPSTLIRWETCTPSTEIKIYLGSLTPELDQVRLTFTDALAFVNRGAIWVGSPRPYFVYGQSHEDALAIGNNFLAVMMHEIGHTLGLPHVEGTIMREDIRFFIHQGPREWESKLAEKLRNYDLAEKWNRRDRLLGQIEQEQALVHSLSSEIDVESELLPTFCSIDLDPELPPTSTGPAVKIRSSERTFQVLTGRTAHGRVRVRFLARVAGTVLDPTAISAKTQAEFRLILKDDLGAREFPLQYRLSKRMQPQLIQQDLFKAAEGPKTLHLEKWQLKLEFSLIASSGQKFDLTGTYWGGSFLNLSYEDSEPELPEILRALPGFKHALTQSEESALRTSAYPYTLFETHSSRLEDRWVFKPGQKDEEE